MDSSFILILKKYKTMKKILIPTDFSENSADALDYALHLMKGQKVHLHILNIVQSAVVPSEVPVATGYITCANRRSTKGTEGIRSILYTVLWKN